MPETGYELLEHPADVKLRAWGATLEELFANAAAGMMAFLFGEHIAPAGWLGMALICASGIAATVLRARAAPDAPGEEH